MRINNKVKWLSVKELRPDPENEEYHSPLSEGEYHTLYRSIEELGIQEPLWITENNMIVSGHERWKIAQKLNLVTVPVKIIEGANRDEIRYLNVSANEARRGDETDPIKKAKRCKVLYEYWGIKPGRPKKSGQDVHLSHVEKTRQDVAEEMGITDRTVRRLLKLLDLVPTLQTLVSQGIIGITAGNELASLPEDEQYQVYQYIQRNNIKEVKTVEIQAIKRELDYLRRQRNQEQDDKSNDDQETGLQEDRVREVVHQGEDNLVELSIQSMKVNTTEVDQTSIGPNSNPQVEDRPWNTHLGKSKMTIDAVAPMFEERNAVNVRKRVLINKLEKAEKQVDSIGQQLVTFFDDIIDHSDVTVKDSVEKLIRRIDALSDRLKEVVKS